jgi:hypothetical protein
MQTASRRALPFVVATFIACCVVQVFLAGLGVFDDPAAFATHAGFAYVFGWLTLVMLVLAIAARGPRGVTGLAALLLAQFALQSVLVALRTSQPAVAALHPLNGFAILFVAMVLLRRARALAREPRAASTLAASAAPYPGSSTRETA